jgi:hypothetical protein
MPACSTCRGCGSGRRRAGKLDNQWAAEAHLAWLAAALATRWGGPAPHGAAADGDAFWQQVTELAQENLVSALLFRQVRLRAVTVPRSVSLWLAAMHGQETWRQEQVRPAVSEVLQTLAQEGVPYLVLKGWGLLPLLYEDDLAQRPAGDLDLYVAPAQRERALAVLRGLGYHDYVAETWPGFALRYDGSVKLQRTPQSSQSLLADLHWQFAASPCYWSSLGSQWLERCRTLSSAGCSVPVPAATDLLLYLCVHMGINHHGERGLLRFHDLALIVHDTRTVLDWDSFIGQTAQAGVTLYVCAVIAQLNGIWPGAVPGAVVERLAALQIDRRARWLYSWQVVHKHDAWSGLVLKVATLPGIRRKLGFLLETAFPSAAYLRQRYGLASEAPWYAGYVKRARIACGQALAHVRRPSRGD